MRRIGPPRGAGCLGPGPWVGTAHAGLLCAALALGAACDVSYPEVVVVNKTAEHIQLRNLSFNGCLWNTVLSYGEATSPGRCLPGQDRIHFQKLDGHTYCQSQVQDGTIEGLCTCDGTHPETDPALINEDPTWFNYQTLSVRRVDYGDFIVFEVQLDDMEQDFSVPGPYGH